MIFRKTSVRFILVSIIVLLGLYLFNLYPIAICSHYTQEKVTEEEKRGHLSQHHNGFDPQVGAPGRNKSDGKWKRLPLEDGFEMYVYSAFHDSRISLASLPVIRAVVVSENVDKKKVFCAIYYNNSKEVKFVEMSKLKTSIGDGRHGKHFQEYIFTCSLNSEVVPSEVTFTFNESVKEALVRVPVEVPLKPTEKHLYCVCVSVSYWHIDPVRLVEWFELQRILGAGLVTIYNNSLTPESSKVFEYYERIGFVDFRQSHNFLSNEEGTFHLHESTVINDCMYRNMHRFEMIAVLDIDEIIIPKKSDDIASLLHSLKRDSEHPAPGFAFRNTYFFDNFPADDSKPTYANTLRQRTRVEFSPVGYSTKSFINPLACTNMHSHYCWGYTPLYNTNNKNIEVDPQLASSQHYKKCHFDVYLKKPGTCDKMMKIKFEDDSMLRFEDRLLNSMKPPLEALGLLKK